MFSTYIYMVTIMLIRNIRLFSACIVAVLGLLLTFPGASAANIIIGETKVLSTSDGGNANLLCSQNAVLSRPAAIISLSFYVMTASGSLRMGIYDATGPYGQPGKLKAQTNSFKAVKGWNTANVITPVTLPAGTYWLTYLPSDNNLQFVKGLTSGISNRFYHCNFWGNACHIFEVAEQRCIPLVVLCDADAFLHIWQRYGR
jgi:hypothetical protein